MRVEPITSRRARPDAFRLWDSHTGALVGRTCAAEEHDGDRFTVARDLVRAANYPGGRAGLCLACHAARMRRRYAANPEHARDRVRCIRARRIREETTA